MQLFIDVSVPRLRIGFKGGWMTHIGVFFSTARHRCNAHEQAQRHRYSCFQCRQVKKSRGNFSVPEPSSTNEQGQRTFIKCRTGYNGGFCDYWFPPIIVNAQAYCCKYSCLKHSTGFIAVFWEARRSIKASDVPFRVLAILHSPQSPLPL